MTPFPRSLLAVARQRRGLLTAQELTQERVVGRSRSQLLNSGVLVSMHRGVYRIGSHVETFEQRCLAACLASPGAALSGPTAGRIWGLRKVFTDDVHIISRGTIHLVGIAAHKTDLLGKFDITAREGLPVLRPIRLFCDLAWHLDDAGLESVFEQMLDRRMFTVPEARAAARRFAAPGRSGSVRLHRVIDSRPAWLKPADSDHEVRLWRALEESGLHFNRQIPVLLDDGTTAHIDMGDPSSLFGIEVDHVTWHGGRLDAQRDKRRDRQLARLGWTISRVPDDDIEHRLSQTVDELRDIAALCAARQSQAS